MAGVLEHLVVAGQPSVLAAPGLGPDRGIINRKAVQQRSIVESLEAFYHVQVFRRASKACVCVEIGRIHDQGISIPPANRVTQPALDVDRASARC